MGDVVLYRSPVLHRPVLHRILVIEHGRYFFKGENNDFVDPGWATRDQLVGKLWIRVPHAGVVFSWFGKPLHSAAIAGLAVLLLVVGGGSSVRRRRRGRPRSAWRKPRVKSHAFMRHVHHPRKRLLALMLLILFTKPLKRRRREVWTQERRIAHRYECVIIDVVSIADGAVATAPPTEIPDFESLATLARYCERPILRETRAGTQSYAVEDGGRLYVYRVAVRPEASGPVAEDVAPPPVDRPRRRSPVLVRFGVLTLLVVVAVTSAVAFIGGNTVPASYAGVSTIAMQIAQLAPPQCAGMNLTNVIVVTGTSANGTSANDLILGRNATGTINLHGGAGDDCIVGAGSTQSTTNALDGGAGTNDVCVGGTGTKNTYTNCEHQY